MALLIKKGYGQVEPNHLAGQKSGAIYAMLPAAASIDEVQNGQFMKYDYAAGHCDVAGDGEYMLVFSEVKLYDPRETYKDFVLKKSNFTDGKIYPRLMLTFPGDHYTTNLVDVTTPHAQLRGKFLQVSESTGILTEVEKASASAELALWQVAMVTTMADGQPAVKVIRVR